MAAPSERNLEIHTGEQTLLGPVLVYEAVQGYQAETIAPIIPTKERRKVIKPLGSLQRAIGIGLLERTSDGSFKYISSTDPKLRDRIFPERNEVVLGPKETARKRNIDRIRARQTAIGLAKRFENLAQGAEDRYATDFLEELKSLNTFNNNLTLEEVTKIILRTKQRKTSQNPELNRVEKRKPTVSEISRRTNNALFAEERGKNTDTTPESPVEIRKITVLPDAIPHPTKGKGGITIVKTVPQKPVEKEQSEDVDLSRMELLSMPKFPSNLKEELACVMVLINPERTGFLYPSIEDYINVRYGKFFESVPEEFRQATREAFYGQARVLLADFIGQIQESDREDKDFSTDRNTHTNYFKTWLTAYNIYETYTAEDIVNLLDRETTFDDVVYVFKEAQITERQKRKKKFDQEETERVNPRFLPEEVYLMANFLYRLSPKDKKFLGINVLPDDKDSLSKLISSLERTDPDLLLRLKGFKGKLHNKIESFLEDPVKYKTGLKDARTNYLLSFFSSLSPQINQELLRLLVS